MSTDLDSVIKKAAVQNGVGLRKDDPIMTLVTIINVLIDDQKAGLSEQQAILLRSFAEKMEESLNRINSDMKENADRSVNAAANFAKDILPKVMTAGVSETTKAARHEFDRMLREFHATMEMFKRVVRIGLGIVAGGAAIGVIIGVVQIAIILQA